MVSILLNTEDRTIQEWGDEFLLSNSPCLEGSTGSELDQLGFNEVYGLWVLIVASVFVGLVLMLAMRYSYRRDPDWLREGEPASLSPAASSDVARKFERGDSRETRNSDLYKIESHL